MKSAAYRVASMVSDVETVFVNLEKLVPEATTSESIFSEEEIIRAEQFKFDCDRRRYLATRKILRTLLGERLNIFPSLVRFKIGMYGKPELDDISCDESLHFNLSHSGGVAAFAFSRKYRVGIDIERIRKIPDADEIASLVFSSREYETYLTLPLEQRELAFLNCWTRKEAFIKANGAGLNYKLSSFDVSLAPDEPPSILDIRNPLDAQRSWRLINLSPTSSHLASLVTVCDR